MFVQTGPNDLSLFQPKCPDTHELANKLFIYYHAKVREGERREGLSDLRTPLHLGLQGWCVCASHVFTTDQY